MLSANDHFLPIAQVIKSYGTEGEVMISVFPQMPEDLDINEPVFFFFEGLPVPFFFESIDFRGNRARVKFEGIDSLSAADELAKMKIYLPKDRMDEDGNESIFLIGYTLYDEEEQLRGTIRDLHNFGGNLCLAVETPEGEEALYPFHEDLICGLDEENKVLVLSIPEGL